MGNDTWIWFIIAGKFWHCGVLFGIIFHSVRANAIEVMGNDLRRSGFMSGVRDLASAYRNHWALISFNFRSLTTCEDCNHKATAKLKSQYYQTDTKYILIFELYDVINTSVLGRLYYTTFFTLIGMIYVINHNTL